MTMDPIRNLIAGTDPLHSNPSGIPDGEAALRRMLSEPAAFSDSAPSGVVSLEDARRRRRAKAAGLLTIAAAAVAVGVLVAGNLGSLTSAPQPASTVAATESTAPTPTPTASGTPTPTGSVPAVLTTNGVECTVANIDQMRNDRKQLREPIPAGDQKYYSVLGCAEGWLAYAISDDGVSNLQLDGGNAWYLIAKLQDGRFFTDFTQVWSSVFTWKFHALNNDVSQNGQQVTPQEAMDKEFADKGIPVELRQRLVGDGPAPADTGGATFQQASQGHIISFQHPAAFKVQPETAGQVDGPLTLRVADGFDTRIASLTFGGPAAVDFDISCGPQGGFEILESVPVQGLADPSARMVYGVFRGEPLHGALLIAHVEGAGEQACTLTPLRVGGLTLNFDTGLAQPSDAGAIDLRFDNTEVARGWTATPEYNQIATVLGTLQVTSQQG